MKNDDICLVLLFSVFHFSFSVNQTTPVPDENLPFWANDPEKQDSVAVNHQPKLNDECDYQMYLDFNQDVANSRTSLTPYNKAVGKKYFDHPHASQTKPKVMNPSFLCIRTDEDKNIDLNEFDCFPSKLDVENVIGYCGCGTRWSQIDLNDNKSYLGLNTTSHSYNYYALSGLDKFLVAQKTNDQSQCVASRFGHCTLDDYKNKPNWNITECKRGYKCRNISMWSPIQKSPIHNQDTNEWYGICISENTQEVLLDPHGFADKQRIQVIVLAYSIVISRL